ncbi:MAG: IclR family transcriptional regulator [Thermosulfidibacteraceae bacterium]
MRGGREEIQLVKAVEHALQVLISYSEREELGVTELSNKLGLHKNNVFRLLATLEQMGYIRQNPRTEAYRLGPKIFELSVVFKYQMGLIKVARPYLEDVWSRFNETTYLGILRDIYAIYIDCIETTNTIRVVPRIGKQLPAYATAIGKAQLAYLSSGEIERLFRDRKLVKFTPNTKTDVKEIENELARVKELGYAIDYEEYQLEVRCVGAPIRDYTGRVIAAISVSGPSYRFPDDRLGLMGEMIREVANEISKALGFV